MNLESVLDSIREIPIALLVHGFPIENTVSGRTVYSPYTGLIQFQDNSRAKVVTRHDGVRVWKYIQS